MMAHGLLRAVTSSINLIGRRDRGAMPRIVVGATVTGPVRRISLTAGLYMPRPEQSTARQRRGFASGRLWLHLRVRVSKRADTKNADATTITCKPLPGTARLC